MTATSEFAAAHDDLRVVARDVLGSGDVWSAATAAGWFGLEVDAALGGAGATFAETAVVAAEVGRATAELAFTGTVLGVAAASSTTPGAPRDELLESAAAGALRLAVATSSSLDTATAAAPFRVESGRLDGRAEYVVDAPDADRLLLVVSSGRGPALVSLDAGRLQIEPVDVLDSTRSIATVVADGVEVAAAEVWAFDDEAAPQRLHDRAATLVALDAAGVAATALERTVAYARDRHQFGRPIGSFQAVKHRCADMAVDLRVGSALLDEAVAAVTSAATSAGLAVSRAKSFVTAAAVDVAGGAVQVHGGIGYTWESGVHILLKRALLDRALYGSPAEHRRRIGERFRARRP